MKKILITGASDGIGLEIARLLAQEGNQLQLVARNQEKLENVIKSLPGKGHGFLIADLSKKEDAHKIADHISTNHYDVLINNAGTGMYGRFEEMSMEQMASMLNLNMFGLTVLSLSYLKSARTGDALVNIASSLGLSSFPGLAAYSATKAYVANFSDALWWENKSKGIYVLGFCPGATYTSFHKTAGGESEAFPKFVMQSAPNVAKELVRALKRRKKPRVVSGITNRFMLFFQRFLSRKMVVSMMGSFSPLNKIKQSVITQNNYGNDSHSLHGRASH